MREPTQASAPPALIGGGIVAYLLAVAFVLGGGVYILPGVGLWLDIGLYFVPLFFLASRGTHDFSPLFVLGLGLVKDMIDGTPLGFWAFLFCLFYILIRNMRGFLSASGYMESWLGFAIVSTFIYTLAAIIGGIRGDMVAAFWANIASALVLSALYPLIAICFNVYFWNSRLREE